MSIRIDKSLLWFNIFTIVQFLFLFIFDISIILIAIGAFTFMVLQTIEGILIPTYWQNNTDNRIKARVFSIRYSTIMFALVMRYVTYAHLVEIVMKGIFRLLSRHFNIIGSHTYLEARLMFIINATIIIIGTIVLIVKQKIYKYE